MNEAKISIILPTYNVEKYIARALKSCINQTLKDIEIIVVDDCGSDNSIKIAKEFTDSRIKIIKNPRNLGLLHARVSGVRAANAKYIMFLDPDDELSQNACEIVWQNIDTDSLLYFNTSIILSSGEIKKNFDHENKEIEVRNISKLKHMSFWQIWSKVYNKELYLQSFLHIKDCSVTMAEDALFCFFYFANFKKIKIINECLYLYYQNEDSCVNSKNYEKIQRNFKDYVQVLNVMKANIDMSYQKEMHKLLSSDFYWYIVNNKIYEILDIQNHDLLDKKQKYFIKSRLYKRKNLIKYLYFKLLYFLYK